MIRKKTAFVIFMFLLLVPFSASAHHDGYNTCNTRISSLNQTGGNVEIIIEAWQGAEGIDSWIEIIRVEDDCDDYDDCYDYGDCCEHQVAQDRIYHNYYRTDHHSYYYRFLDKNPPTGDLAYNLYSNGRWCDSAYIDTGYDLIGPCGVDSTGSINWITPALF